MLPGSHNFHYPVDSHGRKLIDYLKHYIQHTTLIFQQVEFLIY